MIAKAVLFGAMLGLLAANIFIIITTLKENKRSLKTMENKISHKKESFDTISEAEEIEKEPAAEKEDNNEAQPRIEVEANGNMIREVISCNLGSILCESRKWCEGCLQNDLEVETAKLLGDGRIVDTYTRIQCRHLEKCDQLHERLIQKEANKVE